MHRPIFNVCISNVPGPPFPLYVAGAQVLDTYPMGPIFECFGLNITLMSYLDRVDFGLVADPSLVPDVWRIADGLREALEELKAAAEEHIGAKADALAATRNGSSTTAADTTDTADTTATTAETAETAGDRHDRRPDVRPGRREAGGHGLGLVVARVLRARPEEAAQAVLAVAGHDVGVRWGTLWLTRLFMATNDPAAPSTSSMAADRRWAAAK